MSKPGRKLRKETPLFNKTAKPTMFDRKSKNLEVTRKDLGLLIPPKNPSPPPSYSANAPQEPPPDITAAFADLTLNDPAAPAPRPTPDQCLAHLKLLESFYQLREDVSKHDGLFGIQDLFVAQAAGQNEKLLQIREKRWQVYVTKAARRFEVWWRTCVMPNARRQSQTLVTSSASTKDLWTGTTLKFTKSNLPPLGE